MISGQMIQRVKTKYHGYPQTRYIPLVKPNLMNLKASEKDVIDKVNSDKPEIIDAIQSSGKLEDNSEQSLIQIIEECKKGFKK